MTPTDSHSASTKSALHEACQMMKVLSNPERLQLLCALSTQTLNVSALQNLVGIEQPTLSQQLTVLRSEKIVHTQRKGKQIYYSISNAKVLAVLQAVLKTFCPHYTDNPILQRLDQAPKGQPSSSNPPTC